MRAAMIGRGALMDRGSVVGQTILESTDLAGITFTGSTGTGKKVALTSLEYNRKYQLEMGGKNPMVVLDDADVGVAVEAAADSAFFSTGRRCTASSLLIVTGGNVLISTDADAIARHASKFDIVLNAVSANYTIDSRIPTIRCAQGDITFVHFGNQIRLHFNGVGSHFKRRMERQSALNSVTSLCIDTCSHWRLEMGGILRRIGSIRSTPNTGAYSAAVIFDKLVFASGQASIGSNGEVVSGTIVEETQRSLENLRTILQAAGSDIDKVLKCTCYLSDIDDYAEFDATYGSFFGTDLPARTTVEAGLEGLKIEIDAIAVLP